MEQDLLPLFPTVSGLAQARQPFSYRVKGQLGQLSAPAKVYRVRGSTVLDSVTLKNGAFELKGTTGEAAATNLMEANFARLFAFFMPRPVPPRPEPLPYLIFV